MVQCGEGNRCGGLAREKEALKVVPGLGLETRVNQSFIPELVRREKNEGEVNLQKKSPSTEREGVRLGSTKTSGTLTLHAWF